jgi:hypothetical protein
MNKKTTFRAMLIVGAFALLTLPSMFNVTSVKASPATPAPAFECLDEFLSCLANTGGDPDCITQYVACLGVKE